MDKTNNLWEGKESWTGEEGVFLRPTGSHETDPFINQTAQNYDRGSTTSGWFCPYCMSWVKYSELHSCGGIPCNISPPYSYGYVPTWQPTFNPILGEIKELLTKLIELLSRE